MTRLPHGALPARALPHSALPHSAMFIRRERDDRPRNGFTLVEMLVVITIIGILAAITIPTVGSVLRTTKLNAMAAELATLENAIEAYRLDHNDYPPDFSNVHAVNIHLRRAFPRFRIPGQADNSQPGGWGADWEAAEADNSPAYPARLERPTIHRFTLDPAEALVFWLAGVSSDPSDPLFARQPIFVNQADGSSVAVMVGQNNAKAYFDFPLERLSDLDNDGWPEFSSPHADGLPYVYFDGRIQNDTSTPGAKGVCSYAWAVYPREGFPDPASDVGPYRARTFGRDLPLPRAVDMTRVRPYRSTNPLSQTDLANPLQISTWPVDAEVNFTEWVDAGKFQLIAPGIDQSYGFDTVIGDILLFKKFRALVSSGEEDNITSFSDSRTLGDSVE